MSTQEGPVRLGKALKRWRVQLGMTQARLAQHVSENGDADVSERAYAHWEAGRRRPPAHYHSAIARSLGWRLGAVTAVLDAEDLDPDDQDAVDQIVMPDAQEARRRRWELTDHAAHLEEQRRSDAVRGVREASIEVLRRAATGEDDAVSLIAPAGVEDAKQEILRRIPDGGRSGLAAEERTDYEWTERPEDLAAEERAQLLDRAFEGASDEEAEQLLIQAARRARDRRRREV